MRGYGEAPNYRPIRLMSASLQRHGRGPRFRRRPHRARFCGIASHPDSGAVVYDHAPGAARCCPSPHGFFAGSGAGGTSLRPNPSGRSSKTDRAGRKSPRPLRRESANERGLQGEQAGRRLMLGRDLRCLRARIATPLRPSSAWRLKCIRNSGPGCSETKYGEGGGAVS